MTWIRYATMPGRCGFCLVHRRIKATTRLVPFPFTRGFACTRFTCGCYPGLFDCVRWGEWACFTGFFDACHVMFQHKSMESNGGYPLLVFLEHSVAEGGGNKKGDVAIASFILISS